MWSGDHRRPRSQNRCHRADTLGIFSRPGRQSDRGFQLQLARCDFHVTRRTTLALLHKLFTLPVPVKAWCAASCQPPPPRHVCVMRPEFSGEGRQNQRVLRRSARSNQNNIREKIMRVSLFGALATGITASLVGLSAIAADTIRIGLISEITGPNAEAGSYTINGAKLAAEEINKKGGILGKQVELVIEDNQSTNPGTVLAFSKLGGSKEIPAIIRPIRSTQIH